MRSKNWPVEKWLVEFYNGPTVIDGKAQKPIETVEVERAYTPTRWAKNYVLTLGHRLKSDKVNFSITSF